MTTTAAPNFIIHASGSLGGVPDLGNRPYRLHCRFRIGARPSERQLEKATTVALESFVVDMAKQGRVFLPKYGFTRTFKGASVPLMSVDRPRRPPSSREMLPHIMQGAKFRSTDEPTVLSLPRPQESEFWDYDLGAVFLCNTIVADVPERHEERRPA